jgi:DNA invertase Pin-like site-specific DNA recombinase
MGNTEKMAPLRRAARYLRVSRSDQRPGLQADETGDLIDRRGWQLADTFLDQGVSGSKASRPELDRMMAAARRRTFDVLVVWRSDRLFRSLRHMVAALEELAALGIEYVSVTEPFDTTTPQGRLLIHLVSAFAEFERGILQERTRAGLAAAKRRGVRLGRPPAHIDMFKAKAMRAQGKSLRTIGRHFGIGASTLHRLLAQDGGRSASDTSESDAIEAAVAS